LPFRSKTLSLTARHPESKGRYADWTFWQGADPTRESDAFHHLLQFSAEAATLPSRRLPQVSYRTGLVKWGVASCSRRLWELNVGMSWPATESSPNPRHRGCQELCQRALAARCLHNGYVLAGPICRCAIDKIPRLLAYPKRTSSSPIAQGWSCGNWIAFGRFLMAGAMPIRLHWRMLATPSAPAHRFPLHH